MAQETLPPAQETTPTAATFVATVNGEGIGSESFNTHLALYRAAQAQSGTLLATQDIDQTVIDDLIDRLLLAQGARAAGFTADDAIVDDRLNKVVEQAGGQQAFDAWLVAQGFTALAFRQELKLEIEAGQMRTEIAGRVPTSAEQVEARQILLTDEFQAERLLNQLESGTPFETVVQNNDPQRLGTLGWFPRGYLLQPEVEDAAFALQPGEHSQVIQSELGYHIIEVIDRDPDRPLSPQALLALQLKAIEDWLQAQRAQSVIDIQLP
jgi:parvulin-like peptidyl-prolyl isomerase